jgi:hypothetical protein
MSKLTNLSNFVTKKTRTTFSRIFQERKISKDQKMSIFDTLTLTP